ncbi:MAG: molybdopterin-dependent oxidoreductase, partial [Pirellulaceae bacterium]
FVIVKSKMNEQSAPSDNPRNRRLPPGQQLVAADRWPYVGERHPADPTRPWELSIEGEVRHPTTFSLEQIAELPQTRIVTDIHCVTRWSKFDVPFAGVLLETVLQLCGMETSARFVSFVARSERNHSSSLPLEEAIDLGTLLATHVDERPLPPDHGGPLRGIVPGKYFYKSVKWIERIELLAEDRPGFWESDSGYHNQADPWLEQRYISSSIDRRQAVRLIESRKFSGLDLLSIDVRKLDLRGLQAESATLRNANFGGSQLTEADFRRANLSNANVRQADLRQADFADADLEGADFAEADLRGANLSGCSLFGTSFCDTQDDEILNTAITDQHTRIDAAAMDVLTEPQQRWLRGFLAGRSI